MEKITLKYGFDNLLTKYLAEPYNCVLVVNEQTEVTCGGQNDVNFEYCEEHNIPVYNLQRDGGAIVYFAGNVSWAEVKSNSSRDFKLTNIDFLSSLTEYLKTKGINAIQDGNDILVDGFKVASGCAINLPPDFKRTFSCGQICINCDVEVIDHICTKPMKKVPKGLSEYGITTEEIEQFTLNFFKEKEHEKLDQNS